MNPQEKHLLHDKLTGLPSRLLLHDFIALEMTHAKRENRQLTLLHLDPFPISDIDHVFGYKIGDEVLKQAAIRIQGSIRESDTLVRMDADEFAVLMPTVGDEELPIVLNRITNALEIPIELDEVSINIGVMIGLASYPLHCSTPETMMRGALVAVKDAKQQHIQVVHYDGSNDQSASYHLEIFGRLRNALRNERLSLQYQPKLNLKTGKMESVEALLRWPDSGVTPDVFVNIAEKTGLICEITRWVVGHVANQMEAWARQGVNVKVGINISTRDLLDKSFAGFLISTFDHYGVDMDMVVIEVTETSIMTHAKLAIERLTAFREAGAGIAIDDFGTGYSSLSYLRRLPATELKIDKQFITGMLDNPHDSKLVKAVISLAHDFDMYVVAEGVEHLGEADLLRKLGCEMIQGYLFSKPVDAKDIVGLVSTCGGID